jgi:prepilin-type N-terminal cleavage/methylation domain-containing protein
MNKPNEGCRPAPARGFTLLELLVVLAIILVIITLVIVAVRGVVIGANRTSSLNALRQMAAGFTNYTTEHRGQILPGYINPALQTQLGYTAEHNNVQLPGEDAAYYTFRLLPYLDGQWQTLCIDYNNQQLVQLVGDELNADVFGPSSAGANQLGIARFPSFGMNSIFVGGDSDHGGVATDYHPWNTAGNEPIAATRMTQILNPGTLIVFGASRQGNQSLLPAPADTGAGQLATELQLGYAELRPPYLLYNDSSQIWEEPQWLIGPRGQVVPASTAYDTGGPFGIGLPVARAGADDIPVAMADGSAAVEPAGALSTDMTRWSPTTVGKQNVTPAVP